MVINLTFIENILKNINSFETWSVDLDETGNFKKDGSLEFELTDSDDRLWGGRIHSDYNPDEWINLDLDTNYEDDDFTIDKD